jgi:hypothetical protein
MLNWKTRQQLFNSTADNFTDDLNKVNIRTEEDSVTWAVKHFNERVDEWVYPAKSYFVALCYATWIHEDFGDDFYDLLNDKELLAGNDPYFVTYNEDAKTYNAILDQIVLPGSSTQTGMVADVRSYYEEEMLFDQYPLHS